MALAVTRDILQRDGVKGFYRGYMASLFTYVPSSALWWSFYHLYQGTKTMGEEQSNTNHPFHAYANYRSTFQPGTLMVLPAQCPMYCSSAWGNDNNDPNQSTRHNTGQASGNTNKQSQQANKISSTSTHKQCLKCISSTTRS